MMEGYHPLNDADLFSALLDDIPCDVDSLNGDEHNVTIDIEELKIINLKREVYKNWIDLHPTTKRNLIRFEKNGYRIPEMASGDEHVLDLVRAFFLPLIQNTMICCDNVVARAS